MQRQRAGCEHLIFSLQRTKADCRMRVFHTAKSKAAPPSHHESCTGQSLSRTYDSPALSDLDMPSCPGHTQLKDASGLDFPASCSCPTSRGVAHMARAAFYCGSAKTHEVLLYRCHTSTASDGCTQCTGSDRSMGRLAPFGSGSGHFQSLSGQISFL